MVWGKVAPGGWALGTGQDAGMEDSGLILGRRVRLDWILGGGFPGGVGG